MPHSMATIIEDEFDDLTMVSAVTAAIASSQEETKTTVIIDDEFDDLTAVSAASAADFVEFVKTAELKCGVEQGKALVKWGGATWTSEPFSTANGVRTMGEISESLLAEFDGGHEYGFTALPGLSEDAVKALKSRLLVVAQGDSCTVSESFNSALDADTYAKVAKLPFVEKAAAK